MPPSRWIETLAQDSGPPLFYFVTRPFTLGAELWGLPDAAIRVVPFLAIAALVLGVRSLPRGTSRAAYVALLAASLLLTFYAAEARAYALLGAADLALFLLLTRDRRRFGTYAAIALTAAFALWIHYLAIFFVGACMVVALGRKKWKDAAALVAGAVLFLPWVPVLARQPAAATAWLAERPLDTVAGILSSFGGVGRLPPAFGGPVPASIFWLAAAAGLLLVGVLVFSARRDPEIRAALAVTTIALAGTLAAGVFRHVAFAGRTEIAVLPLWIWIVARGAVSSRSGKAAAGAAVALGLVASALALARPRAEPAPSRVAAELSAIARPADLVVAGSAFYLPARLARDRGSLAAPLEAFPHDLEKHPGWFPLAPPEPAAYEALARTLAARPPSGRVWIAIHPLYATPRLREILETRGAALRPIVGAPDALVLLWTAPPYAGKTIP